MRWNLPNILTVLRLLAAPMVVLSFLLLPSPLANVAALGLFAVAAATDWLDGYLARAWRLQSRFGAMLDPIADKAMVALVILALMGWSDLAVAIAAPAAFILLREICVAGLREYLGHEATLQVTRLAKAKTALQMVALAILLAQGIFADYSVAIWMAWLGIASLWAAALVTMLSGADYLRKALPHLRETK